MKHFYKYIALLILSASALSVVAQEEQIKELIDYSGVVLNTNGEYLSGVAVFANKSGNKTITDSNGGFVLKIQENDNIMLSHKIYSTVSFVSDSYIDTIKMTLIGDSPNDHSFSLSQGSIPFERITGSVERITGEELRDFSTPYLQEALAGRLSGLATQQLTGSPTGENFFNTIRGSGAEVYIDGALSGITETTAEIDEVIVAKDYGSAFMYGSTATNGALIINTKRGQPGQKSIDFGLRTGIRNPTFVADMMDGAQYAEAYNTALSGSGLDPIYSDQDIIELKDGSNPLKNPNNDYYEDLHSSPSKYVHATVDLAGGNKNASYFSHVGYYNTNGTESVGDGSQLTRLRTKNNVDINVADYAKVSLGIGASFEMSSGPSMSSDQIFEMRTLNPSNAFPYMINDSVYGKSAEYSSNPYAALTHGSVFKRTDRDVYSRLGLDLDLSALTEGLSLTGMYNIYVFNALQQDLDPTVDQAIPYFRPDALGKDSLLLRNYSYGADDQTWGRSVDFVQRNQHITGALRYNRDFSSSHSLISSINYSYRNESGSQFTQNDIRKNIGASVNYMAMGKYVLEANVLNTVLRQMSKDQRDRLSYDGGMAWLLHKESFINASWIDLLKVRANFGTQLLPVSEFFLYDNLYTGSGAGDFGVPGSQSGSGGYIRSFTTNPDIKIPQKSYLNIGVDYSFLNAKFSGQINYFDQHFTDLIITPTALNS